MKKTLFFLAVMMLIFVTLPGCDKAAPGNVELKIFISQPRFREQYTKYLDQFAEKYKKEKGVTVTYNLEMPDENTGAQLLRTRFASDEGLDIFSCHAVNELPEYTKAGYTEDLSSRPFVAKVFDNIKPVVTIDGKVRAVPLESLFWGILYNKKIFDELKIKPALTISELKEINAKIKAAGFTPFLLAYKEAWIPQLLNSLIIGGLVIYNPGFIDAMNKGAGSFADLKDFFTVIDVVHANGNARALDMDSGAGNVAFASGKYAMYVQGPWMAQGFLDQDKNFQFGVAPLPLNDNPKSAQINIAVSTSLCVNSKSTNKEVALAFLDYVLDDRDSGAFYESLKFNPVAKVHTFATYSWVETAMEYVKQGKGYIDPKIPQPEKDEVGPDLQSYLLGEMTKADMIKALDNAWKSSLK